MMTRFMFCVALLCTAGLVGQTIGVAGVNDFSLNGVGAGGTSAVSLALLGGPQPLDFLVDAAPGNTVLGALGPSVPGAIALAPPYFLDVLPPTIWLNPSSLPAFPLSITTVPPSGLWTLSLVGNVPLGTVTTFQFAVLGPGFATGFGTTQSVTLTGTPDLPNCTINFDAGCPNAASECGATFSGGGGCIFAGLAFCYSTGLKSYSVTPGLPLTITLAGNLNTLNVFFANQDAQSAGTMTFFDVSGTQVGPPVSATGVYILAMPPSQNLTFATPVRSINVTATSGTVWIDEFEINP